MVHNLFGTLKEIPLSASKQARFYSLPALEAAGVGRISRLPVSIRIVLESVLRNCDGEKITEAHVRRLADWQPHASRLDEIPFVVSRIVLQDFTGVPLLVDLAAMRGVAEKMGKNPKLVEPLVPVDLVVDHSVQVDYYGNSQALRLNMEMEFRRNKERYQFIKWGMQALDTRSRPTGNRNCAPSQPGVLGARRLPERWFGISRHARRNRLAHYND